MALPFSPVSTEGAFRDSADHTSLGTRETLRPSCALNPQASGGQSAVESTSYTPLIRILGLLSAT